MEHDPPHPSHASPHNATNTARSATQATFVRKSRHRTWDLEANHEVASPFLLERLRDASTSLLQSGPNTMQRPQRVAVDALRDHNQDSPALLIEPFPPFEITAPLFGVVRMLSPVVLDDQLVLGIAEVESPAPLPIGNTHDHVDLRLW